MHNSLYPRFSESEYMRRYANVGNVMAEQGVSALVLYGTVNAYQEVLYFSNFATMREAMLVLPREGEPALFVQYFNHVQNARLVASIADVRWGGPDITLAAVENLRERGLSEGKIGIVGPVTYKQYGVMREMLPRVEWVDFIPHMMQLRLVKSEEEIEFLRKGAEFSDLAIAALEREARPGIHEYELAAIVEGAYLGLGGKTHIHYMASTPMSHPSVCVPAQRQSSRVIEKGDVLITEISAHYAGYAGQILRPFAIGTPPTAAYQRLYDVAVETYNRIVSVLRDGATTEEVLDAAEYIHQSGLTICDDLLHGFGGGYLSPILRTRRTSARPPQPFTFRENMTVVIQPNVITEDERMGVQVGQLVRITSDGVESLHDYPMRFISAGL